MFHCSPSTVQTPIFSFLCYQVRRAWYFHDIWARKAYLAKYLAFVILNKNLLGIRWRHFAPKYINIGPMLVI